MFILNVNIILFEREVFDAHWTLSETNRKVVFNALMEQGRHKNTGQLDLYLTRDAFKKCHSKMSLRETDQFLKECDQPNDLEDRVTLHTFTEYVLHNSIIGSKQNRTDVENNEEDTPIYSLFQKWDSNGVGAINANDLLAWCLHLRAQQLPNCRINLKVRPKIK